MAPGVKKWQGWEKALWDKRFSSQDTCLCHVEGHTDSLGSCCVHQGWSSNDAVQVRFKSW